MIVEESQIIDQYKGISAVAPCAGRQADTQVLALLYLAVTMQPEGGCLQAKQREASTETNWPKPGPWPPGL